MGGLCEKREIYVKCPFKRILPGHKFPAFFTPSLTGLPSIFTSNWRAQPNLSPSLCCLFNKASIKLFQNISCVNLLFRFPRSRSLNSYFKDLAQRKRWKVFYCQNFTESFSDLRRGKISHHMSSGLTSPRLRLLILKYFHKMVSPHLIQNIFVQWQNKQFWHFLLGSDHWVCP